MALDGKLIGNAFEATAGTNGLVWYVDSKAEKCPCGSGYMECSMAAGEVELYHAAHPSKVEFDDGSEVAVTCPEMHAGPWHRHTPPGPDWGAAENELARMDAYVAQMHASYEQAKAEWEKEHGHPANS